MTPPVADTDPIEWYYMRLPGTTSGYTESDSPGQYFQWLKMFDDETVDRDQVLGLFKVSNGSYVWYKDPTNNKPSWCFIDETPTINVVKGDCWNLNGFGTGRFELSCGGYGNFCLVDYSTNPNSLLWVECYDTLAPVLSRVTRVSHKLDLAKSTTAASSDGLGIWTDTDFMYVNAYNNADMENADWKLDIIDLDTSHTITKASYTLELSTTNGFRDVWSPDTDVTGKIVNADNSTNQASMKRGKDPQWNFKTSKTLPLLDKQTDKCGGFVATTPVDDVRAFNSTTTQSIQKGDANRLVSPLMYTKPDGVWNNPDDRMLYVGQATMNVSTGKLTFDKTWQVPFIVSNPEQWENSVSSATRAAGVCEDDSLMLRVVISGLLITINSLQVSIQPAACLFSK